MKRTTLVILAIAIVCMAAGRYASAQLMPKAAMTPAPRSTFYQTAKDTAVGSTWRLISRQTFTQLSASCSLRAYSTSALDTSVKIKIAGIKADSTRGEELLSLSGTDSVYSAAKWRYLESVAANVTHTGTIKIDGKALGTKMLLTPNESLSSEISQHYAGKSVAGIEYWDARMDSTTAPSAQTNYGFNVELRFYPVSSAAGFSVVDEAFLSSSSSGPREYRMIFPRPILISRGGHIAVYARQSNYDANATKGIIVTKISGYDE